MRRRGVDAGVVARERGVSVNTVSAWLNGTREEDCPEIVMERAPTMWEACYIARKRRGWSEKYLAGRVGVTHLVLRDMERGVGPWWALKDWWDYQGWPLA